jgi:hypothetical protein
MSYTELKRLAENTEKQEKKNKREERISNCNTNHKVRLQDEYHNIPHFEFIRLEFNLRNSAILYNIIKILTRFTIFNFGKSRLSRRLCGHVLRSD